MGHEKEKIPTRTKCEGKKKKSALLLGRSAFQCDFGRQVRESIIITEAERSNLLPKMKNKSDFTYTWSIMQFNYVKFFISVRNYISK